MNIIKKINSQALRVLIDNGYVQEAIPKDIAVASKGKSGNGKTYYAKDKLAFIAWDLLGENPDDQDFQRWKLKGA